MVAYVYRLTCTITQKAYIGITIRHPFQRWGHHVHDAFKQNRDTYFARAIRKHGKDNFTLEVLHVVEHVDDAARLERELISSLGTLAPHGYNSSTGGEILCGAQLHPDSVEKRAAKLRGRKHSVEIRQRMSIAARKRPPTSDATREKRRIIGRGRRQSEASKEKCRQIHLGKPKSEAMKAKLSLLKTGVPRPPESVEKQRATLLAKFAANPKTHCRRGHEFTPENTYYYPNKKGKECRACIYIRRPPARLRPENDLLFGGKFACH